jgi:hypothetical protein
MLLHEWKNIGGLDKFIPPSWCAESYKMAA